MHSSFCAPLLCLDAGERRGRAPSAARGAWRPEPLLCRRFDVPGPVQGSPGAGGRRVALPDRPPGAAGHRCRAGRHGRRPRPRPGQRLRAWARPWRGGRRGCCAGVPGAGGPSGGRLAQRRAGLRKRAGGGLRHAGALADAFLASLGQEARRSLLVICVCGVCSCLRARQSKETSRT